MLTDIGIRTWPVTGEVRPHRYKMGRNRAAGAGHGCRVGDFAATDVIIRAIPSSGCVGIRVFCSQLVDG